MLLPFGGCVADLFVIAMGQGSQMFTTVYYLLHVMLEWSTNYPWVLKGRVPAALPRIGRAVICNWNLSRMWEI